MWYRDHEPEMFDRIVTIVGTKDYINYRLTGRIATDYSYASGTGVYDLLDWDYSDALLAAADLSRDLLPEIVPATQILGSLTAEAADELGLPRNVQVACGGVDNACMALGARCTDEGRTYASLGSSAWIAVSSSRPLLDDAARPYIFTHVIPGMFTSAVAIFACGSSLKWARQHLLVNLAVQAEMQGENVYDVITRTAGESPVGARRLLFNPSLAGGSSLDASMNIRGALLGLDLGHSQADVARAVLEGIALNLRLVLDRLRQLGDIADEMLVVGGCSQSQLWRQILADALEIGILKTNVGQEAGSLGAAAVAAVGAGLWNDFSPIEAVHQLQDECRPIAEHSEVYRRLSPIFCQAAEGQARLGDRLADLK
jgi:xylulokinase